MISGKLFGAILLVSGTTIGAGMLALPVATGLAGFFPSFILMIIIWLYMLLTAFFLLEVNLRMKGESNIISMVKKTLGKPGEIIGWVIYLLLLYSLTAAYIVGCSAILEDFIEFFVSIDVPQWVFPLPLIVLFGAFVYLGTNVVDHLNRLLMLGLILAYIVLIVIGIFNINFELLKYSNFSMLLTAFPIVFTSFGYHIIIPTLTTYLDHDSRQLKLSILIGSLIPLIIYVLWQVIALGIVPIEGSNSLKETLELGLPVTSPLKNILNSPWLATAARAFAFFAIITSFLGVALSLSDFLADGLKIEKTKQGRFGICLLTFLPPLTFALFYPEGFILALNYAGIFVAILLGLLPSLMVWFERYGKETERSFIPSNFKVPGGKPLVIFGILFAIGVIGLEIFNK